MTRNDYILKTRPNYLFICFSIISAVGAAYIAYLLLSSNRDVHGADKTTGHVIAMIFSGFFMLFSLIALWCFIRLETCYLTKDELIISRPLLFIEHKISLADIERIAEKEDKIDIDQKSFKPDLVTIGHSASIWLKNGKQVKISSVEIWDYKVLIKKMHSEIRNRK